MTWITNELRGAVFGGGKSVRKIGRSSDLVEIDDHRYTLWRRFEEGAPLSRMVAFIGLNPSTATPEKLDPTVSKCEHWAKTWGFDGFVMLNLFSYRATEPKEMMDYMCIPRENGFETGYRNGLAIMETCQEAGFVVCCWGNDGRHFGVGKITCELLVEQSIAPHALAINKTGEPKHPLYHKKDVKLEELVRLI